MKGLSGTGPGASYVKPNTSKDKIKKEKTETKKTTIEKHFTDSSTPFPRPKIIELSTSSSDGAASAAPTSESMEMTQEEVKAPAKQLLKEAIEEDKKWKRLKKVYDEDESESSSDGSGISYSPDENEKYAPLSEPRDRTTLNNLKKLIENGYDLKETLSNHLESKLQNKNLFDYENERCLDRGIEVECLKLLIENFGVEDTQKEKIKTILNLDNSRKPQTLEHDLQKYSDLMTIFSKNVDIMELGDDGRQKVTERLKDVVNDFETTYNVGQNEFKQILDRIDPSQEQIKELLNEVVKKNKLFLAVPLFKKFVLKSKPLILNETSRSHDYYDDPNIFSKQIQKELRKIISILKMEEVPQEVLRVTLNYLDALINNVGEETVASELTSDQADKIWENILDSQVPERTDKTAQNKLRAKMNVLLTRYPKKLAEFSPQQRRKLCSLLTINAKTKFEKKHDVIERITETVKLRFDQDLVKGAYQSTKSQGSGGGGYQEKKNRRRYR